MDIKQKKEFFEKTKENIKKDLSSIDQKIISYSLILEKIPNNINELYEQLRVVSDQIYPTFDEYLNIKNYCTYILEKDLSKIDYPKKYEKEIKEIIQGKIGIKLNDHEKKLIIEKLSKNILDLIDYKEKLQKHCEELLKESYYNFYKIAGTSIALKMLKIAGSFKRLSKMPSSTIQLLGSEKTFFKALRKNKKTPKYGCIYNHPLMQNLRKKNKARFARTLAGKISIALKADIGNKDISNTLLEKLQNKIKILKKRKT